jgi:hypothetical protein
MRWIAGLAGVGLLAGCFESRLVYCDNGAICPVSFACTEREANPCGEAENVAPCKTSADRTGCTSDLMPVGTCLSGVCSACTADYLECRYPEWRAMTSPTQTKLLALWAGADDNVYAVGDAGVVLHYDGTSWTQQTGPSTDTLTGIWGSGSELVVVASNGNAFHYTGGAWQSIPPLLDALSSPERLFGVWGSDPSNVLAVGFDATIGKLVGATWQRMTSNDGSSRALSAVSGTSASDVYAVGVNGALLHYNGASWMVDPDSASFTTLQLAGVSAHASGRVVAVGADASGSAVILVKETAGWNKRADVAMRLDGVWVRANDDAFAVGIGGAITHFDGATWQPMTSPTTNELTAVAGTAMNVYAVGLNGTILRYAQ